MYGLDINFLNDREERVFEAKPRSPAGAPAGDRGPLVLGLIAAIIPLALVVAFWAVTRGQVAQLRTRNDQLDAQLAELQIQLQEASGIQTQIDTIRSENNAFVAIFNEIVPWSAVLQDIRNRTPTRVQITDLSQTGGAASEINPEVAPPQAGGISINGVACSYDDVNDFALILQRSPLLQSTSVQIESAQQQGELLEPAIDGTCPGTPAGEPSFLVDYTIAANITDTPASELIDELERQGNVGLVTRLRALRETGVIE